MRYFFLFYLVLSSRQLVAQDIIYIPTYIRYAFPKDSVKLEIKEFPKKSAYFERKNLSTQVWKKAVIDSAIRFNGNVIKVNYLRSSVLFFGNVESIESAKFNKQPGFWATVYHLNPNEMSVLKDSLNKIEKKVERIKFKSLALAFETYDKDAKIEELLYKKEDRIESRKETHPVSNNGYNENRVYLGFTGGMDFALSVSGGLQAEFNFFKNRNYDISVGDKINGMFGFAAIFQNYYYASTKLRLGKFWLQTSFGKEYYFLSGGSGHSRTFKQERIDLDVYWLTFYKQKVGFSIPFRLNSEFDGFPWYGFYIRGELGHFFKK
jgi:hypothetical protein